LAPRRRYLAGGVLFLAAIYQLTPAKDACLRRCRSPLQFILFQWRDGIPGALRMGIVHGAWCVGCCWGLMAALFALGVMSIPWMIVVAGMVAIEKLLPWRALANRLVATTLLVLGLGVTLAPAHLPALTLPDSPAAAKTMHAMPGMRQVSGMGKSSRMGKASGVGKSSEMSRGSGMSSGSMSGRGSMAGQGSTPGQ
jgi:hypothetical protein